MTRARHVDTLGALRLSPSVVRDLGTCAWERLFWCCPVPRLSRHATWRVELERE